MILRGAVLLTAVVLAACGASLNETATSALPSDGATAGLGVPPTTATVAKVEKREERSTKLEPSSAVMKEVRRIERDSTPGSDGYRIGPQDVLEVSVFMAPDLTKTVQVAEGGLINLPLVGDVPAGGRTAQEIERDLKVKLGKNYLQNPQVTVFVREYNSQRVTVEGSIERPGVYPYRGPISLLQLIATAGGLKEVADGTDVVVFRTASGGRQAARFNVDDIKEGRAQDPTIVQGDVVVVTTSFGKKLYQDVLKSLPLVGVFGGLI
jgi:polysaccharide export outer membrane protein